jgi:ribonuclease R
MTMDAAGRVIGRQFHKSIIRSRQRLTYEEAFSVIDPEGKKKRSAKVGEETSSLLRHLNALAQQIRKRRFAQHALDLDVPECEIVIGPDHMMTGVRVVENDLSHQLVEECMVAANEAVAVELSNHGIPQILRIHEPPKEEKIEDLTVQLESLGFRPGDLNQRRVLADFLAEVEGHPLAHHVRVAVLRSMNRALYSVEAKGHFGLAKRFYSHFTSPIRRYADLVVHRQLAALLAHRGKTVYTKEYLASVADVCTEADWTAEEAERELLEIKKYRYLAKELESRHPKVYDAVVVSVVNFGMFVEIVDLQLQGLVHVSTISDKFVRFDRNRGALNAGKEVFKIGRNVKVFVTNVDFEKRRLDFALTK